jgi:signal transduction histidine kinase
MEWQYSYTPELWPTVISIIILVLLGGHGWRYRQVPGAFPFSIGCVFGFLWAAGNLLELAAVDLPTKIFWVKFQGLWMLPSTTAIFFFVLEYTHPGRWLTRRIVILFSVAPIVGAFLILTNDLHHLAWAGFSLNGSLRELPGGGYWFMMVYSYFLGLANIILFIRLFILSPQHHWPVGLMLFGQIGARIIFLIEIRGIEPFASIDSVLPIFAFPFMMYAIAMFGFRIFDPLHLANAVALRQMQEGMLVLDPEWQVISLNPAAENIFNLPARQMRGLFVNKILPSFPFASIPPDGSGIDKQEVSLGSGLDTRYYLMNFSELKDHSEKTLGYLLLFLDVSEQKQAQAQLLEQQKLIASRRERQMLANELHDGISQSLAFLNMQAQTAQMYLKDGNGEAAQSSLERLTNAAGEIHESTRQMIGNLLAVDLAPENFSAILRQILADFAQQTGLVVDLQVNGDLELKTDHLSNFDNLPQPVADQFVHIIQEALTNIRKHALEARRVSVQLKTYGGQTVLTITDDGSGFDSSQMKAEGKRFGLQVMHQRAASVGGQVNIYSVIGQGTCIEVCVPLELLNKEE